MDKVKYLMSKKELKKLHVIHRVIDGKFSISQAACALALSERQIKRLKAGVIKEGESFVIHKNTGRKPAHALPEEIRQKIITLVTNKYFGANHSHLSELLAKYEGIVVSQPTLHRILTSNGIKSPKKHRPSKRHPRRPRKPQEGLLVQIDASPFKWFNGQNVSLHGAIDDATGKILALYFMPTECLEGYFELIRLIIKKHGIPLSFYADQHTIFQATSKKNLSIADELSGQPAPMSQLERALRELHITLIPALSPQAKGRIERMWNTLQSRLPVELRLAGIRDIDSANSFLPSFIQNLNSKFAVCPTQPQKAFMKPCKNLNIDYCLCKKEKRMLDLGSCFSFNGSKYQLTDRGKTLPVIPRSTVTVLFSKRIGIKAEYSGHVYSVRKLIEQPKLNAATD